MYLEDRIGDPDPERRWSNAIVLQGPYEQTITRRSIDIFLERNDSSVLVIVSTYLPSGTGREYFFEELYHFGEGRLVFLICKVPPIVAEFWRTNSQNQNLQRLSSFVGLEYAHSLGIEFSLKCRSDAFLGRSNVCEELRRQIEEYPLNLPEHIPRDQLGIKARIVVSEYSLYIQKHGSIFHIGDQWFFGHTTDLINYFDMTETSTWNGSLGISTKSCCETNMAICWMNNVGIPHRTINFRELLARYFIVGSTNTLEFIWMKYRLFDYEQYMREGKKYILQIPEGERNRHHGTGRVGTARWSVWLREYL